jgi:predicted MFS family arabinose efflux permease
VAGDETPARLTRTEIALTSTRRATLGVALLFLVNGLVVGSWLPRIPELRDRLEIDLAALGLTIAFGGVGSLLGSASSGATVGRFGARRTGLVAAAALYLLLPLLAVVPTAPALALLLSGIGFIDAQADVGMNAAAIRIEESVGRSIMTRLHGLWSLGSLVGAGIGALAVLVGIGLGAQLIGLAVLGIATVLWAGRLVPDSAPRPRSPAPRKRRLALGLVLAGATAAFVEGAPFDWSAIFLVDEMGTSEAVAGTGVILFSAGMLGGRLGGDWVVDRFNPLPTLYTGFALAVLALAVVVTAPEPYVSLIGFTLWGLGVSVAFPILYKLAGSHPALSEGSGLAALTVGNRLGFMVAPALIGAAATAWSLPLAIAVVVGLAAIATAFTIRLTLKGAETMVDSNPPSHNS